MPRVSHDLPASKRTQISYHKNNVHTVWYHTLLLQAIRWFRKLQLYWLCITTRSQNEWYYDENCPTTGQREAWMGCVTYGSPLGAVHVQEAWTVGCNLKADNIIFHSALQVYPPVFIFFQIGRCNWSTITVSNVSKGKRLKQYHIVTTDPRCRAVYLDHQPLHVLHVSSAAFWFVGTNVVHGQDLHQK